MDFDEAVRIMVRWHRENQGRIFPVPSSEVLEAIEIANSYIEAADALDPALEAAQRLAALDEEVDKE